MSYFPQLASFFSPPFAAPARDFHCEKQLAAYDNHPPNDTFPTNFVARAGAVDPQPSKAQSLRLGPPRHPPSRSLFSLLFDPPLPKTMRSAAERMSPPSENRVSRVMIRSAWGATIALGAIAARLGDVLLDSVWEGELVEVGTEENQPNPVCQNKARRHRPLFLWPSWMRKETVYQPCLGL